MIKTALKPTLKVTRQAIKVGGKTGGKIAQAGMRWVLCKGSSETDSCREQDEVNKIW